MRFTTSEDRSGQDWRIASVLECFSRFGTSTFTLMDVRPHARVELDTEAYLGCG